MARTLHKPTAFLASAGLAAGLGLSLAAPPASAVTGGQRTDERAGQVYLSIVSTTGVVGECSGTLIDEEWVLTARHCTTENGGIDEGASEVYVGDSPLAASGRSMDIDEVYPNGSSDVALIELDDEVHSDDLVVGWSEEDEPEVGDVVQFRGWGGQGPDGLLELATQDVASVQGARPGPFNDRLVSVDEEDGDGVAQDGDSGAGVTSEGSTTVRAVQSSATFDAELGGVTGSVVLADVADWIEDVSDVDPVDD